MDKWLIYRHTSTTSGKSYIGLTKCTMEKRWSQHASDAKCGSTLYFHNAIRLYGRGDWIHDVLHDNINSLDEATQLEIYYIKKYNTFENGYNLTIGGEGNNGNKWTEEFRKARCI